MDKKVKVNFDGFVEYEVSYDLAKTIFAGKGSAELVVRHEDGGGTEVSCLQDIRDAEDNGESVVVPLGYISEMHDECKIATFKSQYKEFRYAFEKCVDYDYDEFFQWVVDNKLCDNYTCCSDSHILYYGLQPIVSVESVWVEDNSIYLVIDCDAFHHEKFNFDYLSWAAKVKVLDMMYNHKMKEHDKCRTNKK